MLQTFDAVVQGGGLAGVIDLAGDRLVQRVDQEGGLAAAADPGDAGEGAEGELDGDVGEVVGGGAGDGEILAAALAALGGDGDLAATAEVICGDAVGAGGWRATCRRSR